MHKRSMRQTSFELPCNRLLRNMMGKYGAINGYIEMSCQQMNTRVAGLGEKELRTFLKEESAKKWRKNGHEYYAKVEEEYVEQLSEDFANLDEDDFIDKYDDDISDMVSEYGVPEEFCPVCRKIKQCESDPDWQKYLELKEKFKDINV